MRGYGSLPHISKRPACPSAARARQAEQRLLGALDQCLAGIRYPIVRAGLAIPAKNDIDAMYGIARQAPIVAAGSRRAFSLNRLVHEFFPELNDLATNAGRLI
jgi:hypothetical protein